MKPHHAPVYAAQVQAHHWGCFSCGLAQTPALWDWPSGSDLSQLSPCHHQASLSSLLWLPWNIYVPPHPHKISRLVAQSQGVCLENTRALHRAPSLGWPGLPLQSHKGRVSDRTHQTLAASVAKDVPSFSARAVFSFRSEAEDLFAGSFWSPAFRTSQVIWLQSGGISLRGGGSLAIWNQKVSCSMWAVQRVVGWMQDPTEAYLQVKSAAVVSCPRLTSTEHVQKHTAAAPHICFGSAGFTFNDLRGHMGLWTFQVWFE